MRYVGHKNEVKSDIMHTCVVSSLRQTRPEVVDVKATLNLIGLSVKKVGQLLPSKSKFSGPKFLLETQHGL